MPVDPAHFSLLGVPVRIRGSFLVVTLLLGFVPNRPELTALWLGAAFTCILVHELGHALTAHAFGHVARIELHGMGGTAFHDGVALSVRRRCLVLLAGPFAGFALGALVWPLRSLFPHPVVGVAIDNVLWITWGYGVLNLVPIQPLDGGQVLHTLLRHRFKERGDAIAIAVAAVVGVALVVAVVVAQSQRAFVLLAWLSLTRAPAALELLRLLYDRRHATALRMLQDANARLDFDAVIAQASSVSGLKHAGNRATAQHALAFAYSQKGRFAEAADALSRMPNGWTSDVVLKARILIGSGRDSDAIPLLRGAGAHPEARRLLVQALTKTHAHDDAIAIARADASDHEGKHALEAALFFAGRIEEALRISEELYAERPCATAAYNAACSACRLGRPDDGVAWLIRAVDAGYKNRAHAEGDRDLDAIRDRAEVGALLSRMPGPA